MRLLYARFDLPTKCAKIDVSGKFPLVCMPHAVHCVHARDFNDLVGCFFSTHTPTDGPPSIIDHAFVAVFIDRSKEQTSNGSLPERFRKTGVRAC